MSYACSRASGVRVSVGAKSRSSNLLSSSNPTLSDSSSENDASATMTVCDTTRYQRGEQIIVDYNNERNTCLVHSRPWLRYIPVNQRANKSEE